MHVSFAIALLTRCCSFFWPLHERRATTVAAPIRANRASQCCVRARALCGLRAECRAGVMGSSRKVRSRVHAGVKENRPWLLFAPLFSLSHHTASFLQEDVSAAPPSSPLSNPVTPLCLFFLRLLNLPPTGKRPISPRHEFGTLHHFSTPWEKLLCLESSKSIYIPGGAAVPELWVFPGETFLSRICCPIKPFQMLHFFNACRS